MTSVNTFLPGTPRQIGYVVGDIDAAIETWLKIGVGPWFAMRGLELTSIFRGEPVSYRSSLAFSNIGDMQIELIQQHDDVPTIHQEFLASPNTDPSGYNQFAWWAEDLAATRKAVVDAGWEIVWEGVPGQGAGYFYAQAPGVPTHILEFMELNEQTQGLAALVRGAATDWDGTDPIRSLLIKA